MDEIDIALLLSEWGSGAWPCCPCCKAGEGAVDAPDPHGAGCSMDVALSKRGWTTAADRNAARSRIALVSQPTIPPPPSVTP
jgi:hypothetical protein